jgi:DNA-binding NtrC family response regulator
MLKNVLCVDDNAPVRRSLEMYLHSWNISKVDVAVDYTSAIQKIKETRFDLIILDGLEKECFRIYEDIKEIPHGEVIIFSGNKNILEEAKLRNIPNLSKSNPMSLLEIIEKYMLM